MKKFLLITLFCILIIIPFLYLKNIPNKNADRIPIITFHRLVSENIKNTKYKDNVWVGSIEEFEKSGIKVSDVKDNSIILGYAPRIVN